MAELGIYYVIRHIQTQELMPQGKKNRGYSHWNPSNTNSKFEESLPIPRLIDTRKRAAGCIKAWVSTPNAHRSSSISYYGTEDEGIDIKPDGRKKEDLEIVEIKLVIRSVTK